MVHTWFIEQVPALGPARVVLLACWLWLAAIGVRALPTALRWTGEAARARDGSLALAVLAVALRLGLAPRTPEMRWRLGWSFADNDLQGVEDIQKYGLGWPLLVRVVVALVGRDEAVPYVLNAVLGGLAVLPMVALVRAVGGTTATALWAGLCLACTPLLVWFSHTDCPFQADALFTLLTLLATARYALTHDPRWLTVGVAAVVSTAQMRLESASTGVMAVLLAAAMADRFPWRRPAPWLAAAAAAALLVPHVALVKDAFLVEWAARAQGGRGTGPGLTTFLVLNPTMQAEILIALLPVGLLTGAAPARIRVWAAACLVLTAATTTDIAPSETAFSVARYQLRSLPFAAMVAGLGASALAARAGWTRWLVAAALAFGLRKATTVSVMKTEHDFFDAHLAQVGEPCVIMSWLSQEDTTLFVPWHLSRLRGHDHVWRDIVRDAVPTEGCVAYYKTGGCTDHYQGGPEGLGPRHPTCAAFEAAWAMEPIAEAELASDPVGPMGIANRFPGTPIPVGFYRIRGPVTPR